MKQFKDKNGEVLETSMEVLVPSPTDNDIHNHEFAGTVEDILDDGTVIVIDGETDTFMIKHDRLEIINEEDDHKLIDENKDLIKAIQNSLKK